MQACRMPHAPALLCIQHRPCTPSLAPPHTSPSAPLSPPTLMPTMHSAVRSCSRPCGFSKKSAGRAGSASGKSW